MNETKQRFYDSTEVVGIAHERGLKHVTENTIKVAAYQKPIKLRRTLVAGRVYFTQEAIEAWLAGTDPTA
jgi:O-acetylhomoserine/O-acetylserine sulfhydrylase-like pyridoxal-dependent enzyme